MRSVSVLRENESRISLVYAFLSVIMNRPATEIWSSESRIEAA